MCNCPDQDFKTSLSWTAAPTAYRISESLLACSCIAVLSCMLCACLVLICPAAASADEYVQYLDQGHMNWYTGEIAAESDPFVQDSSAETSLQKTVQARRARVEARKRLWQTLLEIRIDKGLSVRDVLSRDQELAQTILGDIHNSRLQTRRAGGVETRIQALVNLWGKLSGRLIPRSVWFEQTQSKDREAAQVTVHDAANAYTEPASAYTGLIVDLRGLDFHPALIIRIYDEQGQEIYGPTVVDPQAATQKGICLYTTRLQSALSSGRVGDNPLLVRAGGIRQDEASEIQFAPQTAQEFLSASQLEAIYQECRVVLVIREGPS